VTTSDKSLFFALLPTAGRGGSETRIGGQETWLTQALAQVLRHEPGVARRLLADWFEIHVDDDVVPEVRDEDPYLAPWPEVKVKFPCIDLVLEVPGHLVFIENKLDSPLSQYLVVEPSGTTRRIHQAALYQQVLDHHHGDRDGHLVVLGKHQRGDDYKFKTWWDLHKLVEEHLRDAEPTPGFWLAGQFLRFLTEVHLDPPKPLRPGPAFVPRHAARLLAEVGRGLEAGAQINSGGTLTWMALVPGEERERYHSAWFGKDEPHVGVLRFHRTKIGMLDAPPLAENFWYGDLEAQRAELLHLLRCAPSMPPADGARVTAAEALSGNDEIGGLGLQVARRIQARWGAVPTTGKKLSINPEVTFTLGPATSLRVRVTPKVAHLILSPPRAHLQAVREALLAVVGPPAAILRQFQVNLPIQQIRPEQIDAVLDVMVPFITPRGSP
jgi:hypothetical protein